MDESAVDFLLSAPTSCGRDGTLSPLFSVVASVWAASLAVDDGLIVVFLFLDGLRKDDR